MKIFKSKRDKIREFLKDKDWLTLDEIALGVEMGRTKTKETLAGLKKEVDFENDKWKMRSLPPLIKEVEQVPEELPPIDNSDSSVAPLIPQDENIEVHHQGLTGKIDDMQKQLNLVLGMKEKKEKKEAQKIKYWKVEKV